MASFDQATHWVGEHPYLTGATVFGGGLALLWMFGFFSSSATANTNNASTNLAGAFYQAEAAQTQAGAAVQIATLQTTSSTAQTKIQADAATAIQRSQSKMAMTINGQNVGSANTIAGLDLQASMHNSDNLAFENQSNNNARVATNASDNQASLLAQFYNNVLPNLLTLRGGSGSFAGIGTTTLGIGTGAYTPDQLRSAGFSDNQISSLLSVPAAA